jgi:hypothetical protein
VSTYQWRQVVAATEDVYAATVATAGLSLSSAPPSAAFPKRLRSGVPR